MTRRVSQISIVSLIIMLLITPFSANSIFATDCSRDPDWPYAPCYDKSPDLATQISDFDGYYHYKGKEWMEIKKTEMNGAIKNNLLKKWIEEGRSTTEFGNINPNRTVWYYYYLNGQAPYIDEKCITSTAKPYEKCIKQLSPRRQLESGILASNILCNEGLELIFKSSNNSPICIRPAIFFLLVERGFTDPPLIKTPDTRKFEYITCQKPTLTIEELTNQSQYIIIGTVSGYFGSSSSTADTIHNQTAIYTNFPISVEQDLTSQYADNSIVVRTLGGEFENLTVISNCDLTFSLDQKMILFVSHTKHFIENESIQTFEILGAKAGEYVLIDGKAFGPEYPDGIDEAAFISKIKQARSLEKN